MNLKINKRKIQILVSVLVLFVISITAVLIYYFNSEAYFNLLLTRPGEYLDVNFPSFPQTSDNGKLYKTDEGLIILDMNGTESEMGYAHGYLLGNQIKFTVEYTLRVVGSLSVYKNLHDVLIPEYILRNSAYYSEEIEGIVSGAIAAGADMYVESLQRNWDNIDLWMLNTIQDWYQAACSAVGVWGESSSTGEIIIGRDLDFFNDRNGYINQLFIVMIFRGNSIRNDIISFSFPGYIGIISGFNTKGVWIHMDSSNGDMTLLKDRISVSLAMRRFLELEDGTNIKDDSRDFFLEENIAHSVLLMVGSNNAENPVFVLEVRDSIVEIRGETNPMDDYIVLTNHERIIQEPIECKRYNKYLDNINQYKTTEDIKIDAKELLLSQQNCGYNGTINAIQFYPSTLTFRVGYTRITGVDFNEKWKGNNLVGGPWDPLLEKWITWDMLKDN